MAPRLERYAGPADYPRQFRANLDAVEEIADDPAAVALLERLSAATGVGADHLILDLKRYLLYTHEYYPVLLGRGWAYLLRGYAAIIYLALRRGRRARRTPVEVLVDDWFGDALPVFYGEEVVARLRDRWATAAVDVSGYLRIERRDLPGLLRSLPGLLAAAVRARRALGIGVSHYVYDRLKDALSGRALAREFGAAVVISGNDAGLPLVKCKAAGLDTLLLQNGVRGWISDAAFGHADAFLTLEAEGLLSVRTATGCHFERVRPVGSVMLAHHLARRQGTPPSPRFDLLFVSSLETTRPFDAMFKHYAMEHERSAIALVNELAETGSAKVAYYPRGGEEVAALRELGLHSSAVTYLDWRPLGIYAAVDEAETVLTTFSTVGLETLAVGKVAVFVNLSGNELLNPGMREAGLEFTGGDAAALASFIARARSAPRDFGSYVRQHPNLPEAVLEMTAELLSRRGAAADTT